MLYPLLSTAFTATYILNDCLSKYENYSPLTIPDNNGGLIILGKALANLEIDTVVDVYGEYALSIFSEVFIDDELFNQMKGTVFYPKFFNLSYKTIIFYSIFSFLEIICDSEYLIPSQKQQEIFLSDPFLVVPDNSINHFPIEEFILGNSSLW